MTDGKDRLLKILKAMTNEPEPTEPKSIASLDLEVRKLKAQLSRRENEIKELNEQMEFLLPLAARMAMLYIGMDEYEAMREQWDALNVTVRLLEPEIETLISDTVTGRYIDTMKNFLEDNEHYLAQLPKREDESEDDK